MKIISEMRCSWTRHVRRSKRYLTAIIEENGVRHIGKTAAEIHYLNNERYQNEQQPTDNREGVKASRILNYALCRRLTNRKRIFQCDNKKLL